MASYSELTITADEELILRFFSAFARQKVWPKEAWELRTGANRRFLFLDGKKWQEIITFDATDIVLQDPVSGEKTFFAAPSFWQERMQPGKEMDRNINITLWSKSIIEYIKLE